MSIYAVCDAAGLVVNRIVLENPETWAPPEGCVLVQEGAEPYAVGGSITSGSYTPPPVAPAPRIDPVSLSFLAQDFLAQMTVDDATKVQTAVTVNVGMWLLWQSLVGQRDPISTASDRYVAGANALVTVLGADRWTAIKTALGIG